MDNHWELGLVALLGLVIGLLASGMIAGCTWVARRTRDWPIWRAFLLAGSCTAVLGLAAPEILGISYHTISALMVDKVTIVTLGGLMVCKLVATTVSVGVGMPAGLIGPTLVIGGAAGALGGGLAGVLSPDGASSAGFYAMVGMAAMMGTTLRAPLAALMALVEQTSDPHILFPGMLAVATAEIVAWGLVGRDSVFIRLLQKDGPLRFQRL
jgi:H+/Cl- antiporter ClcA